MQLKYIITSDQYLKDSQTGKTSYINIFDKIVLRNPPPTIIGFYICARLEDVPEGNIKISINIFEPDGESIAEEILGGEVRAGSLDIAALFSYVKFEKSGKYSILVEVEGVELENNEVSLPVVES